MDTCIEQCTIEQTWKQESENELVREPSGKAKVDLLSGKLDKLAGCLKLSTFDEKINYKGNLLPLLHSKIEPA